MNSIDDVPTDGQDEGIKDFAYGDPVQLETLKYNEEFQSAMCSLQQNPPAYQHLHATGVDVIETVEWANPNTSGLNGGDEASLLIDDMAVDLDLEESRIRFTIDFTGFLINIFAIYSNILTLSCWIFDEEPFDDVPLTASAVEEPANMDNVVAVKSLLGCAIDMNVIDHLWVRKAFSLGINTEQIMAYNRPELLLLAEQKRKGETYVGRTAASVMSKLYPLFVDNITRFRAGRWTMTESADKKLWVQTDDGRLMKRLSLGPRPTGWDGKADSLADEVKSNNLSCKEVFYVPLKWFSEQAFAKIDTAWPERFTLKMNATVGCYGDIVRFIMSPASQAFSPAEYNVLPITPEGITAPTTDDTASKASIDAALKTLTDAVNSNMTTLGKFSNSTFPQFANVDTAYMSYPAGRQKFRDGDHPTEDNPYLPSGRGTNKHSARGTIPVMGVAYNTTPNARYVLRSEAQKYQGENTEPVIEVSQNPSRYFHDVDVKKYQSALINAYKQNVWVVGDFILKSKAPTSRTKAIQSTYYTNGAGETTTMRVDLTKVIRTAFPINVSPGNPVVGTFPFLPSGVWGNSSSQTDTADFYKIFVVEDSTASMDKLLTGLRSITDMGTFQRYFDEVVYNPWRTGTHAMIGDALEWKLTQTTGFRHGISNNRTGTVPLNNVDDWFYIGTEFQANYEIPAVGIAGYQTRPESANHDIPVRAFLPCIYISAQFDNSLKCLNNSIPSKPRTPHIISFNLVANKPLPNPSQPIVVNGDPQTPVAAGTGTTTPGASGYRVLIVSATSLTVILFADSSVVTNPSEELV